MSVVWTVAAEADIRAALSWLADRDPDAADAFLDRVMHAVQLLADGRFEGPDQQLPGETDVRGWLVDPYRVYYQRQDAVLVILRLYHGKRSPP